MHHPPARRSRLPSPSIARKARILECFSVAPPPVLARECAEAACEPDIKSRVLSGRRSYAGWSQHVNADANDWSASASASHRGEDAGLDAEPHFVPETEWYQTWLNWQEAAGASWFAHLSTRMLWYLLMTEFPQHAGDYFLHAPPRGDAEHVRNYLWSAWETLMPQQQHHRLLAPRNKYLLPLILARHPELVAKLKQACSVLYRTLTAHRRQFWLHHRIQWFYEQALRWYSETATLPIDLRLCDAAVKSTQTTASSPNTTREWEDAKSNVQQEQAPPLSQPKSIPVWGLAPAVWAHPDTWVLQPPRRQTEAQWPTQGVTYQGVVIRKRATRWQLEHTSDDKPQFYWPDASDTVNPYLESSRSLLLRYNTGDLMVAADVPVQHTKQPKTTTVRQYLWVVSGPKQTADKNFRTADPLPKKVVLRVSVAGQMKCAASLVLPGSHSAVIGNVQLIALPVYGSWVVTPLLQWWLGGHNPLPASKASATWQCLHHPSFDSRLLHMVAAWLQVLGHD